QNGFSSVPGPGANDAEKTFSQRALEHPGGDVLWKWPYFRKVGISLPRSRLPICRHVSGLGVSISTNARGVGGSECRLARRATIEDRKGRIASPQGFHLSDSGV